MVMSIFIDAVNKVVENVNVGGIDDIHKRLNCRVFTIVNYETEVVYVDDESLLKEMYVDSVGVCHNMSGFILNGRVLMGSGLIVGVGIDGGDVDSKFSISDVESNITFITFDDPAECPKPNIGIIGFD